MINIKKELLFIVLILLFISCKKNKENIKKDKEAEKISYTSTPKLSNELRLYDIEILRSMYNDKNEDILSEKTQQNIEKYYNELYFSIWERENAIVKKESIIKMIEMYENNPGFGENKQPRNIEWIKNVINNIDIESYPNTLKKAITLRNTDIRMLPTDKPHFYDFEKAGEGFPFDNLQASVLKPAMPLLITHVSKDGKWFYVENNISEGWIDSKDAAYVNQNFMKRWKTDKYAAIISENLSIYDEDGIFRFKTGIGAFFPIRNEDDTKQELNNLEIWFNNEKNNLLIKQESKENLDYNFNEKNDTVEVFIVAEDDKKNAIIKIAKLENNKAVLKPYKFNQKNFIRVLEEMYDENYGWGGSFGNRDCSGLIRDIFIPFGYILPKYSYSQATYKKYFNMKDMDTESKLNFIKNNATPFATILYRKGHVMLYIGNYNDDVIVLHNIWGIKTIDDKGIEGRKIIGKTVLSSIKIDEDIEGATVKMADSINLINDLTIYGEN